MDKSSWSRLAYGLGFPKEFWVTIYIGKWSVNIFHFHFGKGSGNLEYQNDFQNKFFPHKLEILFRNFPEQGTSITLKPFKLMLRQKFPFRQNQ